MKYIVTKQDDAPDNTPGEEEIFLFPRNLEYSVIAPLLGMIKNENYRNWFRVKREVISKGLLVNKVFTSETSRGKQDEKIFNKQIVNHCKYISVSVYDEENNRPFELYVFPKAVHHDCFYEIINNQEEYREIVSAGFVDSNLHCFGSSETLNVKSSIMDTELLKKQMS